MAKTLIRLRVFEDWCDRQGFAWIAASEPGFYAACGFGYDQVLSAIEEAGRGDGYEP